MITSAKYGVQNKYIDVTDKVKELPDTFVVANTHFTDPAPGVLKHIIISFDNGISKLYMENAKINKSILLNKTHPTEASPMMLSYTNVITGKKGLDIGGPHETFYGLDIYDVPASLDNVIYKNLSININREKNIYDFNGQTVPGYEYYTDVVDMSIFDDATYDFVFTPYLFEHLVNPLQALKEITRIIKPKGFCITVIPWKQETGDHNRKITEFSELMDHYQNQRDETDVRDHLYEVLCNYDVNRDPSVNSIENVIKRSLDHYNNRLLNVHVFDFELIKKCFEFFDYNVIDMQLVHPSHQIVLARRNLN